METIETAITVDVPVRTAYNQWTQFEDFPHFMEGIEEVRQQGDKHTHWRANVAGKTEEWDAEIIEQTPDRVVAWRSTTGAYNAGRISFQPLGANQTRLNVRFDYEPQGLVENVGDALGVVKRRVTGDMQRFKEFIESRGVATGAWRGEIHGAQVERTD